MIHTPMFQNHGGSRRGKQLVIGTGSTLLAVIILVTMLETGLHNLSIPKP